MWRGLHSLRSRRIKGREWEKKRRRGRGRGILFLLPFINLLRRLQASKLKIPQINGLISAFAAQKFWPFLMPISLQHDTQRVSQALLMFAAYIHLYARRILIRWNVNIPWAKIPLRHNSLVLLLKPLIVVLIAAFKMFKKRSRRTWRLL